VIAGVKKQALNTEVGNEMLAADWTFPEDKIDARAGSRRGIVVSVQVRACPADRIHYVKAIIQEAL
jgi:hypothetical protein